VSTLEARRALATPSSVATPCSTCATRRRWPRRWHAGTQCNPGARPGAGRIHQHVRSRFIPGFQAAVDAGRAAGALGVCISGSGPTVLALCEGLDSQERVRDAIGRALRAAGVEVEQRLLTPTTQGVLAQIA
jgi:homoserine kinase